MAERLEKSLSYLHWSHIVRAVLEVFHENEKREEQDGLKSRSDFWAGISGLRKEYRDRVQRKWCEITESPEWLFPYSEDLIAVLFFKIRKRQTHEIEAFDNEVYEHYKPAGLFS